MNAPQIKFSELKSKLMERNFPLVGAVDFCDVSPLYDEHAERYRQWIDQSFHGEMEYLKRGLDRRLNPKLVFPELEGVIVVARPYAAQAVGDENIRYARYLNGSDYHESIKQDLEEVFSKSGLKYKVCVDTSAVLERTWAALAGLGWIGKNTLLIHPQLGSYLFLAVVFTNQKFSQPLQFQKDYCGNCERCISSCPTQAIVEAHQVDSRQCISYLTLEKRGEWNKAYNTKGFLAGCDICQEVCPYNTKRVKSLLSSEHEAYLKLNLEELVSETEKNYQQRVKGTALSRIRYADFQRNLKAVTQKS